jgi:hypothetical protein
VKLGVYEKIVLRFQASSSIHKSLNLFQRKNTAFRRINLWIRVFTRELEIPNSSSK